MLSGHAATSVTSTTSARARCSRTASPRCSRPEGERSPTRAPGATVKLPSLVFTVSATSASWLTRMKPLPAAAPGPLALPVLSAKLRQPQQPLSSAPTTSTVWKVTVDLAMAAMGAPAAAVQGRHAPLEWGPAAGAAVPACRLPAALASRSH